MGRPSGVELHGLPSEIPLRHLLTTKQGRFQCRYCFFVNTFNVQPRPRVLFEDVPPDEQKDELVRLVPTAKFILEGQAVHESEYDILVTFAEDASKRAEHLHVLSLGGAKVAKANQAYDFQGTSWTLAQEVTISTGVSSAVAALLRSTVIPHIPEGEKYCWNLTHIDRDSHTWEIKHFDDLAGYCSPVLHLGTEKFVYAFSNRRLGDSGGLQLALPGIAQRPAEWLRIFLDLVADIDPIVCHLTLSGRPANGGHLQKSAGLPMNYKR